MPTIKVRDLMSPNPVTLDDDAPLARAQDLMRTGHFRHLPVVSGGRLVGLITHRDLARETGPEPDPAVSRWTKAGWVMTRNVRTIEPDRTAIEAGELMLESHYGCLPVLEEGRIVGILTEADFVRWVVKALRDRGA